MDDKLKSILGNPELMAQIAAAVKGETAPPSEPYPREQSLPASSFVNPYSGGGNDKALALLAALKPFLSGARQSKLDAVSKAMAVASIYKSTKNT